MNRKGVTRWTPALLLSIESLVENLTAVEPSEPVELDVDPNRSPIARFIKGKTGEVLGEINMLPVDAADPSATAN